MEFGSLLLVDSSIVKLFFHCSLGDILVFNTASAFLMRDVGKQRFDEPRLRFIYVDSGFYSTTTL